MLNCWQDGRMLMPLTGKLVQLRNVKSCASYQSGQASNLEKRKIQQWRLLVLSGYYIPLYKVVRLFCLNLKISITTEPIDSSISEKIDIDPGMIYAKLFLELSLVLVLGYF